ncbi:MAG: hypothetical protein JOZ13_15490 [Alphaproteobacteria bacterium]|nr:hypothetical protein [Alphaproteobacteria bacterium]
MRIFGPMVHGRGARLGGAAAFFLAACTPWTFVGSQLPSDNVVNTCSVPSTGPNSLGSWFASGQVTVNGVVTPDSTHFPADPPSDDCSFYDWSERMFLWLTSPAPSSYGGDGNGMVFNSPVFFTVSPLDANHRRTMTPIVGGLRNMIFTAHVDQNGPHGLPLMRAKSGRLYERAPVLHGPNKLEEVHDGNGRLVEVARAAIGADHKVSLFDRAGRAILLAPKPQHARGITTAQSLTIGGVLAVFDPFGTVIETELGQSDPSQSVLMAQNGSLVYYSIAVNDVYAWFKTGVQDQGIADDSATYPNDSIADHFPDSADSIWRIEDYVAAHTSVNQFTFPDRDAMAVEIKMAWVEAVNLPPGCAYITLQATIPVYTPDTSTPQTKWLQTGTRSATLALISMHVVGSAIGQPAMIWSTFEHVCNAPTVPYTYQSATGSGSSPPESGYWLLSSSDSPASPNVARFGLVPGGLQANNAMTITPGDVRREMPWGTNPSDSVNNSRVIAANYSVRSQIGVNDIRWNYIQTGTTWYEFAGGFVGSQGIWPVAPNDGWQVTTHGTVHLANTAIETFLQGDNPNTSMSCLNCHTNPEDDSLGNMAFHRPGNLGFPHAQGINGGLSHIWGDLEALP